MCQSAISNIPGDGKRQWVTILNITYGKKSLTTHQSNETCGYLDDSPAIKELRAYLDHLAKNASSKCHATHFVKMMLPDGMETLGEREEDKSVYLSMTDGYHSLYCRYCKAGWTSTQNAVTKKYIRTWDGRDGGDAKPCMSFNKF